MHLLLGEKCVLTDNVEAALCMHLHHSAWTDVFITQSFIDKKDTENVMKRVQNASQTDHLPLRELKGQ